MSNAALQIFGDERKRLTAIAYRMLGEKELAEDVVQEVWIRWQSQRHEEIAVPAAWLRVATTRIAIDQLRSARARREIYVGPWLPEPLVEELGDSPEDQYELARECELALLWAMERLNPDERAAFIMRNAFDADYGEISTALSKSPEACRKIVSRAARKVKQHSPTRRATQKEHQDILARFAAAAVAGDMETVTSLLAPDVTAISDGGGKARAALRELHGPAEVAQVTVSVSQKMGGQAVPKPVLANGSPALAILEGSPFDMVYTAAVNADGLIEWIYMMRNPEKLPAVS